MRSAATYFFVQQVQSLEDLSDRTNAGRRCYERLLMCKPYSIWFLSPGREWHDGLTYGTLGQEVCSHPVLLPPLLQYIHSQRR